MNDEADIYGEDIYSSAGMSRPEQPVSSQIAEVEEGSHPRESNTNEHSGMAGLEEGRGSAGDAADVEMLRAQALLAEWQNVAAQAGMDAQHSSTPSALAAELRRAQAAETRLQAEVDAAAATVATLEAQQAARTVEQVQLKRHLHAARQAVDPHIIQLRHLLLDPAVKREFERLRGEVEAKAREAKALQEELQAVHFSQDSKSGRMLMAKCRALQDENEEMGRELAEGKLHAMERQAALAKAAAEDSRRLLSEGEDHLHSLDAENEELQGQVFALRRHNDSSARYENRGNSGGKDTYRRRVQPQQLDSRDARGAHYDSRRPRVR